MTVVLSNGYGRILAVFDSGIQLIATIPVALINFKCVPSTTAEMRQHLMRYCSDIKFLVQFHFA